MFNRDDFIASWNNSPGGPWSDLVKAFIDWVLENELDVAARHTLARSPFTDPAILAMLAFDKAHSEDYGDIRIAVAENPNTPTESLEMIILNEDREDWIWDDWLDYENDDWSDDVDLVADFGNDISEEVTQVSRELARANLDARA